MSYEDLSREELEEVTAKLEEELENTQSKFEEIEEEKQEWEKKAKKFKADLENYKKKQDERKERWKSQARESLAEDLIRIIDNLERAIASADEDSGIVQGVDMVADQLYDELEKRGLKMIDAEGEEFDPNLHKAVDTAEHDEDNKVLEQKRKGYMFGEKVLREAEVVVGKNKD